MKIWSCCGAFLLVLSAVVELMAEEGSVTKAAVVSGVVTYQPDAERPWRYGRYYLKQGKNGPLAETLVCLSGKGLAGKVMKSKKWLMDQKNFEYLPEVLAIQAGDEVEFLNSDKALHNVAAMGGKDPFNVMTPIGKSLVRKFSAAGNENSPIDIRCGLHSQMHAWIFVFDHGYAAVTKADGKFEFNHVPPGQYDLVVIHPSGELRKSVAIIVKPQEVVEEKVILSPDHLLKKK
ncbi:MAG: hypothetical protein L3J39_06160 [Verrucomicrobiales bacterium]|nr:hypothetical protein [Verrucomicrobiales bacterium]